MTNKGILNKNQPNSGCLATSTTMLTTMKQPSWSLLVLLLTLPIVCHAQGWDDSYKLDFSYDPSAGNGPDAWANVQGAGQWSQYNNRLIEQIGNQCGSSNRPSPLKLEDAQQCADVHELLPPQISDGDCTREDIAFDITPYSLRAYFPTSNEQCERPELIVPGRFDPYALLWMELHARAEHVVEGKRYDAELQMVHAGTARDEGQLMTVSLMIDASATQDDLEFEWLLQQWGNAALVESDTCDGRRRQLRQGQLRQVSDYQTNINTSNIQPATHNSQENPQRNLQFSPSPCRTDRFGNGCEPLGPRRRKYPYSMWPSIWYYGYTGSLTSPPCSDIVQWRILDEPM
jgi:hypothetical protein